MSDQRTTYSRTERAIQEQIVDQLTRIGDLIQLALTTPAPEPEPVTRPAPPKPVAPSASNGQTIVYEHPDRRWHVMLRRDSNAESGFVASIEKNAWYRDDLG